MSEAADGTRLAVRIKHTLSKGRLVHPLADGAQGIATSRILLHSEACTTCQSQRLVKRDGECKLLSYITHHEHRSYNKVLTRDDPVEIDQWFLEFHRATQSDVIAVVWIDTAVPVPEAGVPELIVVWCRLAELWRRRRDTERNVWEDRRLEDALRSEKADAMAIEQKALGKNIPRQDSRPSVTATASLLGEEGKRRRPDGLVEITTSHHQPLAWSADHEWSQAIDRNGLSLCNARSASVVTWLTVLISAWQTKSRAHPHGGRRRLAAAPMVRWEGRQGVWTTPATPPTELDEEGRLAMSPPSGAALSLRG